jgi:hypothetical protein
MATADSMTEPQRRAKPASVPSESIPLDLFDAYGKLRTDFSEQDIEGLPQDKRTQFAKLFEAAIAEKSAEEAVILASAEVALATRRLATTEEALRQAQPPLTFIDVHRAAIRANSGRPLDPETARAERKADRALASEIQKAGAAVSAAHDTLAEAREKFYDCQEELRVARRVVAVEIKKWKALFEPVTRESLVRASAARTQEEKLALANGKITPAKPTAPASVLDAAMIARSRGKSTRR